MEKIKTHVGLPEGTGLGRLTKRQTNRQTDKQRMRERERDEQYQRRLKLGHIPFSTG